MERKKELIVKTPDGSVENRYEVEWPTVQNLIDIESYKLILAKGKYTDMIMSGTKGMQRALDYIDMCAYFSVMCPKLITDMKVDIRNMDAFDASKGLMVTYSKQFVPWWDEYQKMVDKFENPDPVGEDSKDQKTTADESGTAK